MVYLMKFRVDGGCRGNGKKNAIGSAACCRYFTHRAVTKRPATRTEDLPPVPTPTNQRAELTALLLALTWALERYAQMDDDDDARPLPKFQVTIISDSRYAVQCMTEWIHKWRASGWRNSRRVEVINRDLIERIAALEDEVKALGKVRYRWAPREENADADRRCNAAMDKQEAERARK